jgi:hypothetical protein
LRVRTGHCPVTAEVPGEGSELVAAGVKREAPVRIACGPTGSRPLLAVHRHREPPQGVRQRGADGGSGRGRQRDHGHHVPRPGEEAHPGQGHRLQDQPDEISYRIRALDPDLISDEQFDEQVRRLRAERDRLKALPAEPDRWDEQLTGDLYADIYQALPASG